MYECLAESEVPYMRKEKQVIVQMRKNEFTRIVRSKRRFDIGAPPC